jgi:RNA polymerase sigma factor (sigma-70 family)
MTSQDPAFSAYKENPTRESLLQVLAAHQDRIYNICFQVLKHVQDSEDAAQRTLLKCAHGIDSIADADAFRSWLYRASLTTALDLRAQRARRHMVERSVAFEQASTLAPERTGEEESELYQAIASLEDAGRDLVVRHYFEKSTLMELAAEQGCSHVAIWKKLEHAKSRLKRLLASSEMGASLLSLEIRLDSILPVKSSQSLLDPSVFTKAALPLGKAVGGAILATKVSGVSTVLLSSLLLATGLGGTLLVGWNRSRREKEAMELQLSEASAELKKVKKQLEQLKGSNASAPRADAATSRTQTPGDREKVAAAAAPSPEAKTQNALRESLRTLLKVSLEARKSGKTDVGMEDPEVQKAMAGLMGYIPAMQNPCKYPEKFSDFTRIAVEVLFEVLGAPLSEEQKAVLAGASERVRTVMAEATDMPVQRQKIAGLQAERILAAQLQETLTEQQGKLLSSSGNDAYVISSSNSSATAQALPASGAAAQIAKDWAQKYKLDEPEQVAALASAQVFAEAVARLDQEYDVALALSNPQPPTHLKGDFSYQLSAYDYRIRSLQAQLGALQALEASLSPKGRDLIHALPMTEYQGPRPQGLPEK